MLFSALKWTCCNVWTCFPSHLGRACLGKKLLPYLGINLQWRCWFLRNCEIMFATLHLPECDKAVIRPAFSCARDSSLTQGSSCFRHTLSAALSSPHPTLTLTLSFGDYFNQYGSQVSLPYQSKSLTVPFSALSAAHLSLLNLEIHGDEVVKLLQSFCNYFLLF